MKIRAVQTGFQILSKFRGFSLATLLAIMFQRREREVRPRMHQHAHNGMTLHGISGARKYLNATERRRFQAAASRAPAEVRLFCLLLLWSGCRVSEVLALTPASVDLDRSVVTIETLKRRRRGLIREVPLPKPLVPELEGQFSIRTEQRNSHSSYRRLWAWSRTTAWRRLKSIMASADIHGLSASPKGLRHTFGVTAFQANIPSHLVQRWLGHASLRTTAIYGQVSGREERAFAARMWR
jgi:integrase/recombinase XerD